MAIYYLIKKKKKKHCVETVCRLVKYKLEQYTSINTIIL